MLTKMSSARDLGDRWLPGVVQQNPACNMDNAPIGYFRIPSSIIPTMVERMVAGDPLSFAIYADMDSSPVRFCYRMMDANGGLSAWAFGDLFMSEALEERQPNCPPTPAPPPPTSCPACPKQSASPLWMVYVLVGVLFILLVGRYLTKK